MTLPALDTSEMSFIAFYNVLDNGATTIDPLETTSEMETYTEYSNGVDGTVAYDGWTEPNKIPARDPRMVDVRVKDDGWVIAWFDRTQQFKRMTQETLAGRHDLMHDWTEWPNAVSATQNTLERVVNSLVSALSNSGNVAYSAGDVALYDYEYPDANGITMVSRGQEATWDITFTPTSGTTLHDVLVTASSNSPDYGSEGINFWASSQENIKMSTGAEWSVYDALGNGTVSAGETTTLSNTNAYSETCGSILAVWS